MDTVQSVASHILERIPSMYVQPEQEQPGISTFHGPVPEVPVINLGDVDKDRVLSQIVEASKEWGIFQVVNHGVPIETMKELERVGKEFFESPAEEKEKIAMEPGHFEGYGSGTLRKDFGGKKNWADFLFQIIWPVEQVNYNYWPQNPPDYRKATEEYAKYMAPLVDRIFEYLSLGLGLDKETLKEASGGDNLLFLMKVNYYPPCPRPDLTLGVASHTDMSALTLLIPNEVQGLQVFKDDHWFDAKYVHDAIIIHIGDQIEILSNGKYKCVLHRSIVNKDEVRMSWPLFCEPPKEFIIGPLPQLVNEEIPAKFKTKKYGDYQYCKINKLPQ